MYDARRDSLRDDLVEDRLSSPVTPGGGDGLRLFLLTSSRTGRHVAQDRGYARARGDAAAAAEDGVVECGEC